MCERFWTLPDVSDERVTLALFNLFKTSAKTGLTADVGLITMPGAAPLRCVDKEL